MSLPLVILSALFGAAAGAFVPRVAHRLAVPFGAPSRSSCADCAGPFPAGSPGWVRAGPACRCDTGWWRTVLGSAVASAVTAAALGPRRILPVLLMAVVLGVLLARIDLRCLRLPDPLVASLGLLVAVPVAVAAPQRLPAALLGAAVFGAAYLTPAVLSRGGLGLGDVKLAVVLGFLLGFLGRPAALAGLLVPPLLNGPIALYLLATRRIGPGTGLPFGPALLLGALAGVTAT